MLVCVRVRVCVRMVLHVQMHVIWYHCDVNSVLKKAYIERAWGRKA